MFHSDRATVTNYLIRRGNYLTWVMIEHDPAYITEPLIRSTEYQIDQHQNIPPYPCNVVEEVDRPRGMVPHHLPSSPLFVDEVKYFADKYNIPFEVIVGRGDDVSGDRAEDRADPKAAPAKAPRRPQEK